MSLNWIFFDVGGVLIDETEYTNWKKSTVLELIQAYQPELQRADVERAWIPASIQTGSLMQNVARLLLPNQKEAETVVALLQDKHDEMEVARKRQRIFPEARDVLAQLSQKYQLGLLANQPVETRLLLNDAGLLELFRHTNVSGDYPYQKPDPRYFLHTLKDTGARAEESVMIDDNPERGLMPAKRLGMTTVWRKTSERTEIPQGTVDYTIMNLRELLDIFLKK